MHIFVLLHDEILSIYICRSITNLWGSLCHFFLLTDVGDLVLALSKVATQLNQLNLSLPERALLQASVLVASGIWLLCVAVLCFRTSFYTIMLYLKGTG